MFKVALVNMPFASPLLPSIALTQLQSVLASEMNGQVDCKVHYLNHDFVEYFTPEVYQSISDSVTLTVSGLGDWLFRHVAFPDLEDNSDAYLQRHGHLLRSQFSWIQRHDELRGGLDAFLDELIDRYQLDDHSLVGFTSMFAQNVASFALARKLKERNRDVVVVMGGANCETTMGQVIVRNFESVDFLFSGPALKTFPQFVEALRQGNEDECHSIHGVFSKAKLSRNFAAPENEVGAERDLDEAIPLDYDDFLASLAEHYPDATPSLLFETSRGCWWGERSHCTFCGLNGSTMNYRSMSPDLALRQFDGLFRYSPRVSRYESVDNILPRKYLEDVLPKLKPPKDVSIFYEVKADLKDHEMCVLAEAGVTEIQPGIEALASSTLRLMKKGTTAFHNLQFLKSCVVYEILPTWNVLIGFPGEHEAVYRKYMNDLPLLTHLPPPNGVYPVRFDRFSPYHNLAKEYGLELRPYEFYSMVYPFPERDLNDLAYFFADHNYENAYQAYTGRWITKLAAVAEHWNTRWHQRDGKVKPRLAFEWRGNTKIVSDTRTGEDVEHELEPAGLRLLEMLSRPTIRSRMAERIDGESDSEIEHQLEVLRTKGLVFEEEDRYVSLVVNTHGEQGYV